MCSNIKTKNPTTPYSCRYTTFWNVRHRTQAGDDSDPSAAYAYSA